MDEKWCIRIYPGGVNAASKNYISLYLMLLSSKQTHVNASLQFHLINSNDEKCITTNFEQSQILFVPGIEWGFKRFTKRSNLFNNSLGLLPNDVITISCDITYLHPDTSVNIVATPSNQIENNLIDSELSTDFGNLFENQKLTDVTFYVKGRKIKAHKFILTSQSEVFRAMFETEMQEKLTNKVKIVDIEYEVFEAMLHFMYTDELPNSSMVKELLVAADKYALYRLKALCEKEMFANITTENSTRVLVIADFYNCEQLKIQTLDFIISFAKFIIHTEGWRSLEETYPHLIVETYAEMVKRQIKY
ncbi:unnamed protein product [Ceutorhynchus assimilis]|uniref:Speckle-type POZ protein n=1 Tax=Ceutorhynchus assimilis TaxID=467358 RepID=A0A9N9MNS6_9CUCU|nr:unnamed protein product [Ceutorhynchus assimilis]